VAPPRRWARRGFFPWGSDRSRGIIGVVRPEAVVFLIAVGVVVLIGVISRLRRGPVDERQDHPFPYTPTVFGIVLAALTLVAAGLGWAVLLPGRVVAKTRHRRR
jgi:hypothetical protein